MNFFNIFLLSWDDINFVKKYIFYFGNFLNIFVFHNICQAKMLAMRAKILAA